MSLADDLRAAKALIDTQEKWTKGYPTARSCACIWTACNRVQSPSIAPYGLGIEDDGKESDLVYFLSGFVPAKFQTRARLRGLRLLPLFNDDPATTHNDVLALFDRAIKTAEAA